MAKIYQFTGVINMIRNQMTDKEFKKNNISVNNIEYSRRNTNSLKNNTASFIKMLQIVKILVIK